MKIAGIIAEYNPFHNGHAHLIDRARAQKAGCEATHVVAVMSGQFVQRGEPALLPKAERVKMALNSGVDLVLELPTPWALSSAENFAKGGVAVLDALGCVDTLCFGSECGDIDALKKIADIMETERYATLLRYRMDGGNSYADASQKAVLEIAGERSSSLMSSPNNILGLEYIKALRKANSSMQPFTVERMGAAHDAVAPIGTTASASYLRTVIESGKMLNAAPYMPPTAYRLLAEAAERGHAPANAALLERSILAKLRQMTPAEIAACAGISEGLENRVKEAANTAASLEELETAVKTKRYPLTRIRRMLWSVYLGIPAEMANGTPPYVRVLGYTPRGREILDKAKKAHAPLLGRASQAERLEGVAREIWELENRVSDLYALTLPTPFPCGIECTTGMIKVE